VNIVNLQSGTENQIFETSDLDFVDFVVHPTSYQFLVSYGGQFTWYDNSGDVVKHKPWPSNLDEYTKKNAAFVEGDLYESPYYEMGIGGGYVGPSYLQYSSDGRHLVNLPGAIGGHIDDRIPGAKLVVSRDDGSNPTLVMKDYVRVRDFKWSSTLDRLFVVYMKDGEKDRLYLEVININS
jgi:hypothetical protein